MNNFYSEIAAELDRAKKKYNENRRRKYRNDPVYRDKEKARKMADYKPHPVIRFRDERGRFAGSEKVEA